jgi:hypothetical protein
VRFNLQNNLWTNVHALRSGKFFDCVGSDFINAVDAMLSLQEFVNNGTLQGLKLAAADADSSGYVNAVDALLIAKRFVGLISAFPAGDWYTEIAQIQAVQGNNLSAFLKCICTGDVDGSYSPPAQK